MNDRSFTTGWPTLEISSKNILIATFLLQFIKDYSKNWLVKMTTLLRLKPVLKIEEITNYIPS